MSKVLDDFWKYYENEKPDTKIGNWMKHFQKASKKDTLAYTSVLQAVFFVSERARCNNGYTVSNYMYIVKPLSYAIYNMYDELRKVADT